ncbi:hypothetical protein FWD07_00070 [Candidatus Saccharibacteria bacterium]|nr:hypothetical protein [Candidatus Saccharibacteria bacterium]
MQVELQTVGDVVRRVHFVILEIERGFGFEEVVAAIGSEGVVRVDPTIHEKQKTEQINVEDVAFLERICRNKQAGRQVFLLVGTEKMGEVAQNKFLKLLEEPAENVGFVFLTEDSGNLLETVKSRAQIFRVTRISDKESEELLSEVDAVKKRQIWFLAAGLPGEIKKLAEDGDYFDERKKLIDVAKVLINGSDYDKMKVIQTLKDDRERAVEVVELAIQIMKATTEKDGSVKKLGELNAAHEMLAGNIGVRLALVGCVGC